ncbi:hypothetical protein [Treponema endosymbiont of Eucomonympha sp.]|nr:hypothetical protein [Treponema endosymbiont of Eucomonympha sp.]
MIGQHPIPAIDGLSGEFNKKVPYPSVFTGEPASKTIAPNQGTFIVLA